MPCTAAELGRILSATELRDRAVTRVGLQASGEDVLVVPQPSHSVLGDWKTARILLRETGRWPVATVAWSDQGLDGHVFRDVLYDGTTLPAFRRRAGAMAVGTARQLLEDRFSRLDAPPADEAELQADSARRALDKAPTVAEILGGIGPGTTDREVERWMLEWQLRAGARYRQQPEMPRWFEPSAAEGCFLAFLPTPSSEDTIACLPFFGEEGMNPWPEVVQVLLRAWREEFGAELVAHWGTMLQLIVDRPPESIEAAWPLAWDHYRIAPDDFLATSTMVRDRAWALIGAERWFLQARP